VALKGAKAKPSELDAATTPVASRLLKSYAEAKQAFGAAVAGTPQAQAAKDKMDALVLFKADIAAYVRLYGFLSQIFDYGNTEVEKRSIFFRLLHPLLTYGREREGVDLSALKLTAYTIKSLGDAALNLTVGEPEKLYVIDKLGSGQVQDKTQVALADLIAKVNDLFEGDLTPGDKLVYVNDVIKGKLLESEKLTEQAANNTKEQFANSPDLPHEILSAVMDALAAHTAMSKQALASDKLLADMKDVLLGAGKLWEGLRGKAAGPAPTP
jgi:type I restriction enzyme R subunit